VTQDHLPTQWSRLHPLSPLVRTGRGVVAVLVALGARGAAVHQPPWIDLAVVGVAAVAGVVAWLVTRWRIHNGELQLDTGLIRRQQVRVPLTRLQGVDLVRPLLARMIGVSEVRLVLAGHDTNRASLAYLGEQRAVQVRAQLLALAHGLADDTPEPPERPVLSVRGGRIVAAHLLAFRFVLGVLVLIAAIGLAVVSPKAAAGGFGFLFFLVLVTLVVTFRQIAAEWEFQVAEAPDGLRLRGGLLQTRAETIPYGRVQAIRWVEPLWWRPLGWVRLEIDVARRRNSNRGDRGSGVNTRALLPAGSRDEARWLLSRVLPGAAAELAVTDRGPTRAVWRAPLARRYQRTRHDDRYVACSTGRLRPDVVIVPLEKVQSIRWSQGPWSRRLRLATLDFDTAGQRFAGRARWRDVDEAQHWLAQLPDLAREARRRTATPLPSASTEG